MWHRPNPAAWLLAAVACHSKVVTATKTTTRTTRIKDTKETKETKETMDIMDIMDINAINLLHNQCCTKRRRIFLHPNLVVACVYNLLSSF